MVYFATASAWLLLLGGAAALPSAPHAANSSNVLPPSKDPWYTAPPGYESTVPGTVLRVREAPQLQQKVVNSSAAYNILYRTTDSRYQPTFAVTTLYAPKRVRTGHEGAALLSYGPAYDSANPDYAPSYTFITGDALVDPGIESGLGRGWYVTVPDYEGPHASFSAGVMSGHAMLDSVRASRSAKRGLGPNGPSALWGYSGGALASEWAAELQVQYAPELALAGVALGGLTPNASSVLATINRTPAAADAVNAVLGLMSQFPDLERYIRSKLKASGPYNATGFLAARTQTTAADSKQYSDQNIFDYFVDGAAVLDSPIVARAVDSDGIMGYHGVPASPVFVYKAIQDEFSPVVDTDALVDRYCNVGANIWYQRNRIGGHLAEFFNGEDRAMAFLTSVLEGSTLPGRPLTGCVVQTGTYGNDTSPE